MVKYYVVRGVVATLSSFWVCHVYMDVIDTALPT